MFTPTVVEGSPSGQPARGHEDIVHRIDAHAAVSRGNRSVEVSGRFQFRQVLERICAVAVVTRGARGKVGGVPFGERHELASRSSRRLNAQCHLNLLPR